MTLQAIKRALHETEAVHFRLPDGSIVPEHFHVTEVGKIDKHFIDCGGTVRQESLINFQLYTAEDYDHRLAARKLQSIIALTESSLGLNENLEIEVEYQGSTIEKYGLEWREKSFHLIAKQTDCLAKDNCGIPGEKTKRSLAELSQAASACRPGSGCC